jgi:hypothetical protein
MSQVVVREYEEEPLPGVDIENTDINVEATDEENVTEPEQSTDLNEKDKEEIYYHYTVDLKDPDPWLKVHKYKVAVIVMLIGLAFGGNFLYKEHQKNILTASYVDKPKIDDVYFLDFRLIKDNLRPTEKYRMAKLTDITGEIITLNYSSYFYPQKSELNDTIRFAQLRFEKFFQEKRNNFTIQQLKDMVNTGAIFLVRRPEGNMLDGNLVVPDKQFATSKVFLPGKKENLAGLEYLKLEQSDELAFEKFEESADLGYAVGQINLAQMYLTGKGVEKDFSEALYWLKQSALQVNESAIVKYGIVCEQVASCDVNDFYKELLKAGVNIEFSKTVMK